MAHYSIYLNMHDFRLLGLAIRARWLGFAELDAQKHLLDWGMIFYQRRTTSEIKSAKKRLEDLLALTNPTLIVLVLPGLKANERVPAERSLARSLRAAGSSRTIRITPVERKVIRTAFAQFKTRSKYQIAVILARAFPELSWKLSPNPRIWAKEDSRMALFDALAGVIALHKHKFSNISEND